MNDISPNNEDRRFDRLVDNELSEAERRELLTGLDDEPGGWRRCALAFLEAQCWKAAFRSVAKENAPARWGARWDGSSTATPTVEPTAESVLPAPTAQPAPRRRSTWLGRAETALAMAASFAAALLVASWFQQARTPVGVDSGNQVVATPAPGNQPPGPMGGARRELSPNGPWQMVTLTSPSAAADGAAPLRLPAVERQDVDEAWLRGLPSAIPDDVLQALSRNGYKIQQKRELVPVPMKDGRRLVVPVEQVELHYIGNGAY